MNTTVIGGVVWKICQQKWMSDAGNRMFEDPLSRIHPLTSKKMSTFHLLQSNILTSCPNYQIGSIFDKSKPTKNEHNGRG